MTFSNFTSLTIGLLAGGILLNLLHFSMTWLQSRRSKIQLGNNHSTKQMQTILNAINSLQQKIDQIKLHAADTNSNANKTYQRASDMIKQSYTNDEIIATCKLAKGEVELLRVLNTHKK